MTTEERFYYRDPCSPKPNVLVHPGSAAIILDERRRILILKRAHGVHWCLPGGRIEIGESAAGCCIRETREETGLDVDVLRLIGLYSDPTSICCYPDGNVHQSYIALFECRIVGEELRESEEAGRFHWMDREEMDHFPLLPDSALCCSDAWANQEAAFIR